MRGNDDYRKRARKGAMKYDADKVAERYWKPTLEDIEAHLEADREIGEELAKVELPGDIFLKSDATRAKEKAE